MSDFKGAGIKPGVQVWRIENLKPVAWPEKDFGKFFQGDSYIVLKTKQRQGSSTFEWDIFFWLGSDTTQDEMGVAAYKTVELDESLGGGPVQHRETQGYESEQFMQCFKSVQYMKGGAASGFKKVERGVHEDQLLQLKGNRVVRCSPVPTKASSLNAGDVFILVKSDVIIQWNGSESNKKEKRKALEVTTAIKDEERGGKARIMVCEQGEEPAVFWESLGGKGPIKPPVSDDDVAAQKCVPKLIRVSDAAGSLVTSPVAEGDLNKTMLDTKDVFLLDVGSEIYVWIGKGASQDERKGGMKVGTDYCAQGSRPKGTKVTKVLETSEPATFKANFSTWAEPVGLQPFGYTPRTSKKEEDKSIGDHVGSMLAGVGNMFSGKRNSRSSSMAGVEPVSTEVWRIEDFKEVPLEKDFFGQFYAGDSYIVKYTYKNGSKEEYMIYIWQGATSSQDEKGASALVATKMDDALGGAATQVRVEMGKEPSHFVKLFDGKMVVRSGGKASGFANRGDTDSYDTDGTELFQVRGNDPKSTRAVQVPEAASSLNSGDCFVLLTPSTLFVWQGSGANESEVETATKVAETLKFARAFEHIVEGSEPDAFWSAIGGKGEYPQTKVALDVEREPMLFHCSNETGTFKIEPIYEFAQADLEEDDVHILDVYTSVFVWLGSESNQLEKEKATESAQEYIKAQGYPEGTSVVVVKSGQEPPIFTMNFLGWDSTPKKKFVDPYEAKLAAALAANPAEVKEAPKRTPSVGSAEIGSDFKAPGSMSVTYEQLKAALPAGVDPTKKEQYLSDAEFEKVLGSPRGEFNAMKPWKQTQIKKAKGLF